LQKSAAAEGLAAIKLMSAGFDPPTLAALRNFDANRCTKPEWVVAERPAMRAVVDSERWRPRQIHPGRLLGHEVEADQASGCA